MKKVYLLLLSVLLSFYASATTLTWTGGATGNDSTNLLAAANWSPAQVPQGGDVLVMTKAVTLAPGVFDFGSAGLTISNTATVTFYTCFQGSGKLTIGGAGQLTNNAQWQHTGGTLLLDGCLYQSARYEYGTKTETKYPIGTGTFEIRRSAGSAPWLSNQNWNKNYAPMLISGSYVSANSAEIQHNNPPTYGGAITAEDDFTVKALWTNTTNPGGTFSGGISAHGHTVHVDNAGAKYASTYGGTVDASFDIQKGYTWFSGLVGTDADATLTLKSGTLTMNATTSWAGKSVSLTDATAVLAVNASGNLSQDTELTLATGAKLKFAANCHLYVAKLTVNGTVQPDGDYTAETLPDVITGSGTLHVGATAPRIVWTGKGGDTLWTTAANWSPQVIPTGNATAVFESDVTLAECAAALTGGTLTIEINNGAYITSSVKFSGTGSIVKTGTGYYKACKASTFEGGVTIVGGKIGINAGNVFGCSTNLVTIDFTQSGAPRLDGLSWGPTFKNPVDIKGTTGSPLAIYCSNALTVQGLVTADCDFEAKTGYGPLSFTGGVSAHGHTMTYNVSSAFHDSENDLQGTFDVALTATGVGCRRSLTCQGIGIDHALKLTAGTNILTSAFTWEGTNIVISGAKTCVIANATANFSPAADIRISGGAKLQIACNYLQVSKLFVDGVEMTGGAYRSTEISSLVGDGTICVGDGINRWIGTGKGDWDEASNWSLNHSPQSGETAVFDRSVEFYSSSGTVDVGAKGLTINNVAYHYLLASNIVFTGEGPITIESGNTFRMYRLKWTNRGGTNIRCYEYRIDNKCAFGPGPINLIRTSLRDARINTADAGTELVVTNDVNITGPYKDNWAIYFNNDCTWKGKFTADADFKISEGWSNRKWGPNGWVGTDCPFSVDAPGHTMYLTGGGLQLMGTYNCSIVATNTSNDFILWNLGFNSTFRGTDPDATLMVDKTNTFDSAAVWAGTNIVVYGRGQMRFNGAGNIPAASKLALQDTAGLYIDKGVRVKVAEFVVNGVTQPEGIYGAGRAPTGASEGVSARFAGKGRLVIGEPGGVILVR